MDKKRKKCYNSGKISGLPYLTAYNNFLAADKDIEAMREEYNQRRRFMCDRFNAIVENYE